MSYPLGKMMDMEAQMRLLPGGDTSTADEDRAPWRIDDTTREVGREGISQARAALRQARRPGPQHTHTTAA